MIFFKYCKMIEVGFLFDDNSSSINAEKLMSVGHITRHITSVHYFKLQCALEFQVNFNKIWQIWVSLHDWPYFHLKIRLSLKLFLFAHCLEQQIYCFTAITSASIFLKNCFDKESVCADIISYNTILCLFIIISLFL